MVAQPSRRPVTAAELEAMGSDAPYELHRGMLVGVCAASPRSSYVGARILVRLASYVERRRLGVYGNSEGGFILSHDPDTVRSPDAWFVRKERVPASGVPSTYWAIAPDLAIEVVSPTDRFAAVLRKAQDYLDAGSRLVWVFDPEGRTTAVFRPGQPPQLLSESDTLDGEDVVPGFRLKLKDAFA